MDNTTLNETQTPAQDVQKDTELLIIFWGTRGGISAPKPDQLTFGVHTTCIEIRQGSESLLFDAGFGIGRYSDSLSKKSGTYHLFFTHFHWDHVQGIGYFIPIFLPSTHLHLYSPWKVERLKRQLNYYFDYSFGPFESIDVLSSSIYYHSLETPISINGFTISFYPNVHEGNCYGYSISRNGKKIAIMTDHEDRRHDSGSLWGNDYDVVIHDAEYTDEEYRASRKGFGHSCYSHAVANARSMGAKTILMTHHAPLRTDQELLEIESSFQQQYRDVNIFLAREQVKYPVI
ncbi:beta-lactamase-like protein [Candidatus Moduliflexus flocculans]|uniref:Beta-lactamase-like protein n=1 Tax=Candidatus Moduliflexus flocculans TaxID=1499966 RepID=A0A081BM76_9BACT|nr:beta-lactamase-like protein [Candidatus Moduliflexus flocculans]